jgi:N-acetylglucosamine malate deacetylase 1
MAARKVEPRRIALAIAAHPDDIEIFMAGTLLLLKDAGWDVHYMNLSSGSLGSTVMTVAKTKATRRREAQTAAKRLGATWHPPIFDDMEILYSVPALRKVAAVVRKVNPSVVLTHPPVDYMEDHTETCRLAVSAAFVKNFPNYVSVPKSPTGSGEVTVYHSMPHMLSDTFGNPVLPTSWVDTTTVMDRKTHALEAHACQRKWLDDTQGLGYFVETMQEFGRTQGKASRKFAFAEGWRRHLHAGFCAADTNPLRDVLGARYLAV